MMSLPLGLKTWLSPSIRKITGLFANRSTDQSRSVATRGQVKRQFVTKDKTPDDLSPGVLLFLVEVASIEHAAQLIDKTIFVC